MLKEDIRTISLISLGIFLFTLFFEPFSLPLQAFESRLVFLAGMAGIVFLVTAVVRAAFPQTAAAAAEHSLRNVLISYGSGFTMLVLSSVALAFYLRFVGSVNISFYVMFRIILICMAPPVALRTISRWKELTARNATLLSEKENAGQRTDGATEASLPRPVEFISENFNDNITLLTSEVVYMRSADNYVEIYHHEEGQLKKKLIRNTLSNVELLLKPFPAFIRCHRTCIVNREFAESFYSKDHNYWLHLQGANEEIPVSRQYVLKIKEAMAKGKG